MTSENNFYNYLLIVDHYSKITKLYGMGKITTEEVMDKLDIFQSRFVKIGEFGWWDLERISANVGTQFTSTEFKEEFQISGVLLPLAVPEHQEINGQVEVTWRTLDKISHYLMVHARVSEAYIDLALIYNTDHIFPVLPIRDMINEDGEPNTPFKLATGTKPSI